MPLSRRLIISLAALSIGSVAGLSHVHAEDAAPTNLACTFETGSTWAYADGQFNSRPPAKLSFEIAAINLEAQSATLVRDDKKSGNLKIVRALNANHFLEVAQEGFLNLTTVYDLDPKSGRYPAVHSRHSGIVGQPVFAQYAGTCVDK